MDIKENDELLKKRFTELARKSYDRGVYTYTDFLNMQEAQLYHSMSRELSYVPSELFGGYADSERCMLRFGSEEVTGFDESFPISCISIEPLMDKFADDLTHRDFLGALMNLGIERGLLGDILVDGKSAVVFCKTSMAEYISKELTRIKHTTVRCRIVEPDTVKLPLPEPAEKIVSVSSNRADAIISKLYNLSRSDSSALFAAQRVFVNGRVQTSCAYSLKPDEKVTVRGFGRFDFCGVEYINKKGKSCAKLRVY